jgi:hypothetical protein
MWHLSYRVMSPEERRELERAKRACSRWSARLVSTLTVALLGASVSIVTLVATAWVPLVRPESWLFLGACLASAALWGWWYGCRSYPVDREALGLMEQDLKQGEVEVTEVRATGAIKMLGTGRVPPGYFLEVGPEEVMFIEMPRGASFSVGGVARGHEEVFPCREFQVARALSSRVDLFLTCRGEPLLPIAEMAPLEGPRYEEFLVDGGVFPARLHSLKQDLDSLLKEVEEFIGSRSVCPR